MADEPKQPWYRSVPGTLTAATGFIAALSGLVAGINQLGLFKREHPAPPAASAPAPAASAPVAPSTVASGGSSNAGGSAAKGEESSTAPPGATVPKPQRPASRAPATPSTAPSAPPSGAAPTPASAAGGDTTTRTQRLPSGTKLQLVVPARTCAADGKEERFTARLVAPVRVGDATVLAPKTTAVLYLKKSGSSTPDVRLESVIQQKQPISVPSSDVQVTSGAGGGCLRAGARLTAALKAALTVRR